MAVSVVAKKCNRLRRVGRDVEEQFKRQAAPVDVNAAFKIRNDPERHDNFAMALPKASRMRENCILREFPGFLRASQSTFAIPIVRQIYNPMSIRNDFSNWCKNVTGRGDAACQLLFEDLEFLLEFLMQCLFEFPLQFHLRFEFLLQYLFELLLLLFFQFC